MRVTKQVMVLVEVEAGEHEQERAVERVHRALSGRDRPYLMQVSALATLRRALRRASAAVFPSRRVELEEAEPRCGLCGTTEPCDQHPAHHP